MTPDEAGAFAGILAELAEVYGEVVSPVRARLYFESLSGFTVRQVRRAARDLVTSHHFFPRPADFFEAITAQAERAEEYPALYPHVEPIDPVVFKALLAETLARLSYERVEK